MTVSPIIPNICKIGTVTPIFKMTNIWKEGRKPVIIQICGLPWKLSGKDVLVLLHKFSFDSPCLEFHFAWCYYC